MKKVFTIIFAIFLSIVIVKAQTPDYFNYQAVVRTNSGELMANQSVDVRISVINNSLTGSVIYTELHKVITSEYGIIDLKIGNGTPELGIFSSIDWTQHNKYINTQIDAGSGYVDLGTTQLLSVPFSFYSKQSDSARVAVSAHNANKLSTDGVYSTNTDTLFVVKDHQGNVVFAVFPDGAQVYVNEQAKGKVGGFAVSGRNPSKFTETEIFRVTSDSTRVYVNDGATSKGKVGGFAVSGRNPSKGNSDIFFVTSDSTRVYINETLQTKGKVGGFAVSGRNPSKGIMNNYLNVSSDSTRIYFKDTVAGFSISNIEEGSSSSLLNLNKQNYFIGHQTGENNESGKYNSMIGYQAGYTNSSGSNNIFFGYRAGYSNVTGGNNVFIGTESGYVNQYTFQNTYIGYRSGYDLSGAGNTVMGSMAGENAGGGNNTFIGTSAGRKATGGNNTFVGNGAGNSFNANTGVRNTYIGQATGSFTTTGSYNVMLGFNAGYLNYEGSNNTFVGYNAGRNIHQGSGNVFIGHEAGSYADGISNRFIVENENVDSTETLLYGEFDQNHLRINGNVGINYQAVNGYGLIVEDAPGQAVNYTLLVRGDIYALGSYLPSDEKFKKDISPLTNAIAGISQLSVVNYKWKTKDFPDKKFTEEKQVGFLAQEVEEAFPELVKEDAQGNKAINYSKFTPIIVEAIKEQQNYIDELELKNQQLEQRLRKLEEIILK